MNILITGANGFIGKNISLFLSEKKHKIYKFSHDMRLNDLSEIIHKIDFIFHLAGVNRPVDKKEFYSGNTTYTKSLINYIESNSLCIPILYASSKQASLDNAYGESKRLGENLICYYSEKNNIPCFIYRLPGVFGKWSKPNYNSVIATWCYQITRNGQITVDDRNKILELAYIDDVVLEFSNQLKVSTSNFKGVVSNTYNKKLGEIMDLLNNFRINQETLLVPRSGSSFERALYATYLSYLPKNMFAYELIQHKDERGSFFEFIKTVDSGQISISVTNPGESIVRGNHYHNTKNEKFLVVRGEALIEMRDVYSLEKISYEVSSKKLMVVEMIPGYTHNIRNISDEEMILIIWANESFDKQLPDTYLMEV